MSVVHYGFPNIVVVNFLSNKRFIEFFAKSISLHHNVTCIESAFNNFLKVDIVTLLLFV